MITVCLCTYNGAKYIDIQIRSILAQLEKDDEIIISDDLSSDDTIKLIRAINDARIKIYSNSRRLGHVQNFAHAISLASGDYILLSDQDDVWLPNRLNAMLASLSKRSNALLLASNFDLIDVNGISIGTCEFLKPPPKSHFIRIIAMFVGKMPYYGCTFIFKRKLIPIILPIPSFIDAHDFWIAALANVFGDVVNFKGSTLQHRIHANSTTPKSRRPLLVIAKSRLQYLVAILGRIVRQNFLFRFARRNDAPLVDSKRSNMQHY